MHLKQQSTLIQPRISVYTKTNKGDQHTVNKRSRSFVVLFCDIYIYNIAVSKKNILCDSSEEPISSYICIRLEVICIAHMRLP